LVPIVKFPDGSTIHTIEGAVQGAPGKVRVLYKPGLPVPSKAPALASQEAAGAD